MVVTPAVDRDPVGGARDDSSPIHEGSERLEHVPYLNPAVLPVCGEYLREDMVRTSPGGLRSTIRHRIPSTSVGQSRDPIPNRGKPVRSL